MEETSIIRGGMLKINSPADLIKLWKPRRLLADAIRVDLDTVHKWAQKNRIPTKYHFSVLSAAKAAGIAISAEDMVRIHAKSPTNGSALVQGKHTVVAGETA